MEKSSNLVGQRFGKLTVIEKTDKTEDRYFTWRCKCDCGGEITVNTKRLKRGTVTDCGCVPKNNNLRGPIPVDITGKRFGKLTAISRADNRKGRTCWLCQCECGNKCIVTTHELNSGKTKSCGCLGKKLLQNRAVDIRNQRFGRLVALCATEKRDKKGSVYWHCVCDCGNELDVTYDSLVYGHYKSCGCYKKEIMKSIHEKLTMVDSTCIEFLHSRKARMDSQSGVRGVSKNKNGKWRAYIGLQNKRYNIGTYESLAEAISARKEAEKILHEGFIETYQHWLEKAEGDCNWAESNPFFFEVRKTKTSFNVRTPFGQSSDTYNSFGGRL